MNSKDRINIIRERQKYRREANICYPSERVTQGDDFVNDKHCADEIAVFCVLAGGLCFVAGVCWYVVKLFF
jgi:hypothetical protein